MVPARRRTRTLWAAALLTALAGLLGGCATAPPANPADDALAAVRARSGVEVRWWPTATDHEAFREALAGRAVPKPSLDPAAAARWAASGFKLLEIPIESLAQIERALPPLGIQQRLWLGWPASWAEVMRGRRLPRAVPLWVDDRRELLGPGQFRFIARAWPTRDEHGRSSQIELSAQLIPPAAEPQETDPFAAPTLTQPGAQGLNIRGLTLRTRLPEGVMLVVVPLNPAEPWDKGSGEDRAAVAPFGPPSEPEATAGELMLSVARGTERPARAIVVLIPVLLPAE